MLPNIKVTQPVKELTDMSLNEKIAEEAKALTADIEECNLRIRKKLKRNEMVVLSLRAVQ